MQKLIAVVVISYFVVLGAQLVAFSLLALDRELWENLAIAAVFTLVSVLLGLHFKGDYAWTLPASAPSSTNEIASTAT